MLRPMAFCSRTWNMSTSVVCLVWSVFLLVVVCASVSAQVDTLVDATAVADLREELTECQGYADTLSNEIERYKKQVMVLKAQVEEMQAMEDQEDEDSNESHSRSRGLRSRRAASCEAGTLAAWACAPQCIFKLKGLCGLSLKSICHC